VVATGIEADVATQPQPGKVFTFPATRTGPAAAAPAAEQAEDDSTLDLTQDEDGDELLLDSDDILTSPVASAPIAPPADEDLGDADTPTASETPAAPRESGTLFERMSNIARGAAKAQGDDEQAPEFRREPIDIPRFLNRQNNQ
jgi:cell division protein FtsZ